MYSSLNTAYHAHPSIHPFLSNSLSTGVQWDIYFRLNCFKD